MAWSFESYRQLAAFRDFSSLVKSPSFVRPLSIYGRVLSIGPALESPFVVHTSPTYVALLTDTHIPLSLLLPLLYSLLSLPFSLFLYIHIKIYILMYMHICILFLLSFKPHKSCSFDTKNSKEIIYLWNIISHILKNYTIVPTFYKINKWIILRGFQRILHLLCQTVLLSFVSWSNYYTKTHIFRLNQLCI